MDWQTTARRAWIAGAGLALLALLAPASAGKNKNKGKGKQAWKTGSVDPTSTPLFDSDGAVKGPGNSLSPGTWTDAATAQQIRAYEAHATATGRGAVVVVLDGGFNLNHPAISPNISADAYDLIDGDADPNDLGNGVDDDGDGIVDNGVGHGTFVIGMVLLSAPDATVVPVRIHDDEGNALNDALTKGVHYAMSLGADVINISASTSAFKRTQLRYAIRDAIEQGIVVVRSAGNDSEEKTKPARRAIRVCAVDHYDRLADFSNTFPEADPVMVCAPGVDLYGPLGIPTDDGYGRWSGTSFAAALVSGAVALVKGLHPDHTPADVRDDLMGSLDPVWDQYGNPVDQAGRINLEKLVE